MLRGLAPFLLFSLLAVFAFPNLVPVAIIAYAQAMVNTVYAIFYQQDPFSFKFAKYQLIINAIFGLCSVLYVVIWAADHLN